MSKRKTGWNENKIKKYLKEGRGTGKGKEYKPWITIQDLPSKGRASRTAGWKTNRTHHYLSDNETRYHYLLEWSDIIVDIREQYPLLNREETQSIAKEIGVKHPVDQHNKNVPIVLTTDFLITLEVEDGKELTVARTVKPHKELDKKRVLEKLEIERRYWLKRNIDWGIVTDKEIPKKMTRNIEWIYSAYRLEPTNELDIKGLLVVASMLKKKLEINQDSLLNEVLSELEQEVNLEEGLALYLFKHLIARKEIILDISETIQVNMPVKTIKKIVFDSNYQKELLA